MTADPDGSARAAVPGGVLVAAPEGLTITALSDGTAAVRDGAGAFVAGLTTDPWGTGLVQVGADVVRLDDGADLWFTSVAVESAVWGEAEGGRDLHHPGPRHRVGPAPLAAEDRQRGRQDDRRREEQREPGDSGVR